MGVLYFSLQTDYTQPVCCNANLPCNLLTEELSAAKGQPTFALGTCDGLTSAVSLPVFRKTVDQPTD